MNNQSSVIKNKRIVQILRNLLGGRNGIWTAISEYIFQSSLDNNISKDLIPIANHKLQDALHISKSIVDLNFKPYIENGKGLPWSSRFVNYTSDPLVFLQNNINNSEKFIKDLEYAINKIEIIEIKELLGDILEQEQKHLEKFVKMLRSLENSGSQ